MKSSHLRLASWGEDLAAEFMRSLGYEILDRNVRTSYGEIDLVVRRTELENESTDLAPLTVFVEVKTRTSTVYGYPEQAVNARKRLHLIASAQEYIQLHPELTGDWRVDVVAILRPHGETSPQIQIFENAVTAD